MPSKSTYPALMKTSVERNIIYFSLLVQAALTFVVIGFCTVQLNRCPVDSPTKENADGGFADLGSCPRALYTNMITAAVSYWFPAPWYAFVNSGKEAPDIAPRKRTTRAKAKADEMVVIEEEEELK